MAVVTWQGGESTDGSVADVIASDGSRRLMARRATEVAGGPGLAAIVDPLADLLHGPRPGAVVCLAGRPRAAVVFPDADPHGLVWSPDGAHLLVTTDFIDWLR